MERSSLVTVLILKICWFLYGSAIEMGHIGRGPTFGDFVTIRTEASMQDVSVARLQSTRVQTSLSPCGQSKYSLGNSNTKEKGIVGNLCISLFRYLTVMYTE